MAVADDDVCKAAPTGVRGVDVAAGGDEQGEEATEVAVAHALIGPEQPDVVGMAAVAHRVAREKAPDPVVVPDLVDHLFLVAADRHDSPVSSVLVFEGAHDTHFRDGLTPELRPTDWRPWSGPGRRPGHAHPEGREETSRNASNCLIDMRELV